MKQQFLTKSEVEEIAFKQSFSVAKLIDLGAKSENPVFIYDACEITGYSRATIYSFVHKKEMPFHKTAGRRQLYFYKSELLEWMKTGKKKEAGNE